MNDNVGEVLYPLESMRSQLSTIIRQMMLNKFKPDCIAAVSRGGLVPGVYLSHYFDVELVVIVVDDAHYPKADIAIHKIADTLRENKLVLLVDDICDKGTTFRNIWDALYKMCPEIETKSGINNNTTVVERCLHSAALIYNEGEELFCPDYYGTAINKTDDPSWIVFGWEAWW